MTVAEMIQKLQEYPQDLEVKITDGFRFQLYKGDFESQLFEDVDGTQMVDIGIGGFDEDEE
jgi:hypothetical protein